MTFFGRCSRVILRISGDLWYFWPIFKFDFEDYFWEGGGDNNHDEIYNTYRVFFGHIMKFSGRYSISDFEDFWKIMTFFGRYSRVIWIDFEDFWQITTFLAYILGDFEDILPPPLWVTITITKFTLHMVPFLNKFWHFLADIPVWFWWFWTNYVIPPPGTTTTIKFTLSIMHFLDKLWHFLADILVWVWGFWTNYEPPPPPPGTITTTKFILHQICLLDFEDFFSNFDIFWPIL